MVWSAWGGSTGDGKPEGREGASDQWGPGSSEDYPAHWNTPRSPN